MAHMHTNELINQLIENVGKKSTKNVHPNLLLLIDDRSTLYLVEVSLHFPRVDWLLLKFT